MKIILIVLFITMSTITSAQSIKVISFNIRYANEHDGNNRWSLRKTSVIDFVQYEEPDFMGVQEALLSQINDMKSALGNYQWIGGGRDDGKEKGEFSPIFFRADKWELIASHTFWLSETPDKPSRSWDADLPRICTWGHFRHRDTHREITVFNTHYDHKGKTAREKSSTVILEQLKARTGFKNVILTGDFNAEANTPEIKLLTASPLADAYEVSTLRFGEKGTFNGFDPTKIPTGRIDYVFVSPDFSVEKYSVDSRLIDRRFLSDHFPIIVIVTPQ